MYTDWAKFGGMFHYMYFTAGLLSVQTTAISMSVCSHFSRNHMPNFTCSLYMLPVASQSSDNSVICYVLPFLAQDVIYTSRAYAMMPVRLSDGSALAHYS